MLDFDIEFRRGDFVLEIAAQLNGAVTGLYGASGAGKSTLLNLIAGLLQPQRGRIVLADEVLVDTATRKNVPAHRRRVGYVFQDGQLFPHLTVQQNLLYGYSLLNNKDRHFAIAPVVGMLELESLLARYPRQLSGGERQRVALGRAILCSPRLLLLDEPLAALDDRLKQQILPFLLRIRDETRIPMLYVSHAMNEINYLTMHCLTLERGREAARSDVSGHQ